MEKLPPRFLRLTDKHIISQKFNKLCLLAEELELQIMIDCGRMFIKDFTTGEELSVIDCDSDDNCIESFPPVTDFYIRKDNPAYIKEYKIQEDKRLAEREAKQNELNAKKAQEDCIRKAKQESSIQEKEKQILATLKAKYE